MIITIKDEVFEKMLENPIFTCDGCACGEWGYPLSNDLHIYVYRSCRKSSMTPDEKLWNLHKIEFYKAASYIQSKFKEKMYLDEIEVDEDDYLENVRLNEKQEKILINKLKQVSRDGWGNEYRHED